MELLPNNFAENDDEVAPIEEAGPIDEQERPAVLVVDDEAEIRDVLRLMLTRAGYEVREADDGNSALDRIHDDPPELILLDVLMPGMDGFEVCRKVRADSEAAHIPILMLSARTDTRSRQEGIRAGATEYLTKPIAYDQLVQHVAAALRDGGD